MARGELVKKLIASYGHDEAFRAIVEQIISEEERKNNHVLARSLRKTLDNIGSTTRQARGLSRLPAFPDEVNDFILRVKPARGSQDILLSPENTELFLGLVREFRQADRIRRYGLPVRSKLLFCGPPGTGKTLCAEVFANQLGLPLFHVRLDSLISSYLGETAKNIRKTFEFACKERCVLFFDKFDAIARSREEAGEHSELRRVVNSLLIFIEQIQPDGFVIAATNLDGHLDPAVWRRFDEIAWFDAPDTSMIGKYLARAFRNVRTSFEPSEYTDQLQGYSYAELERVCVQAMKLSVLGGKNAVGDADFREAMRDAERRLRRKKKLEEQAGD
jgi:SpoVK/Ycf46/Vps4 family AAA+-type ATPase